MTIPHLKRAEEFWLVGDDAAAEQALAAAEADARAGPAQTLGYARLLLRMRRLRDVILTLRRACSSFPDTHQLPDLLVDAYAQVGDADGAIEAYGLAVARGLPPQSLAARRATGVAVWAGRFHEMGALIGDGAASPMLAECRATLARERTIFDRFEARLRQEKSDAPPTVEDVRRAIAAKEPAYASHLFVAAARSPSILEGDLLDVAYGSHPPTAPAHLFLAFFAWRLLQRFPASPLAKLEVGIYGLLQFGDRQGARTMLDEALAAPDEVLNRPGAADRALRLATSCAMFDVVNERQVVGVAGRLWPLLQRKELAILANAFAARAAPPLLRHIPPGGAKSRPHVAVCMSGQLRSFRSAWPHTKVALASLDVTLFVSTWNRTGAGFGAGNSVARKLAPSVRERLAGPLQMRAFFASRYPSTYALFDASDSVTHDECAAFFGTRYVAVHDENAFEVAHGDAPRLMQAGTLNQAKMFAGIHDAIAMMRRYEAEHGMRFDAVVRTRPDLEVRRIAEGDIRRVMNKRVLASTHIRIGAVGDVFFIMSPDVADIVGEIWPAVQRTGSFAIVPGASGAAAEPALGETLCWNGVRVLQLRDSHLGGLHSVTVPPDDMWRTLQRDLAQLSEYDGDDIAVASAISEALGRGTIATQSQLVTRLQSDSLTD